MTVDEFGDFELTLEWKLSPNGNSGLFYRVTEDDAVMWHTAPEYQIIDNAYKEPLKPVQYTGANYDLHPPSRDVTKPIGAWNQTRMLVRGAHVEHWLNGVKVVEYELWTPDWERRVRESKFKDYADLRPRAARPHRAAGPRRSRGVPEHQDPRVSALIRHQSICRIRRRPALRMRPTHRRECPGGSESLSPDTAGSAADRRP